MVSTGSDAQDVEAALKAVRQMSWAAGRTFRPKYLVLLAFAEVRIAPSRTRETRVLSSTLGNVACGPIKVLSQLLSTSPPPLPYHLKKGGKCRGLLLFASEQV